MKSRKVKIYVDGPEINEIKNFLKFDGFTFNPSLFKKLGATNYIEFSKKILKETKNKPISIEVFADDFAGGEENLTPAKAKHRPCGLAMDKNGALYISDDQAGTIWKIVYTVK